MIKGFSSTEQLETAERKSQVRNFLWMNISYFVLLMFLLLGTQRGAKNERSGNEKIRNGAEAIKFAERKTEVGEGKGAKAQFLYFHSSFLFLERIATAPREKNSDPKSAEWKNGTVRQP